MMQPFPSSVKRHSADRSGALLPAAAQVEDGEGIGDREDRAFA